MATYQEAINRLSQKLRDDEAWPDDSSKLTEQLHLLYNAAMAVAKDIPLSRLDSVTTSAEITSQSAGANMLRYPLPDDVFSFRDDLGIKRMSFDGVDVFPHQSLPYDALYYRAGIGFVMHAHQIYFSISRPERIIYSSYAGDVKVLYVKQPQKPTQASEVFPLNDDNDFEVACSVVASHVGGETINPTQVSTFQAFLTQLYGDSREREQTQQSA